MLIVVLTGVFRWDLKGLQVLGKVKTGKGTLPFGMPLNKVQWKYFSHTVRAWFGLQESG